MRMEEEERREGKESGRIFMKEREGRPRRNIDRSIDR